MILKKNFIITLVTALFITFNCFSQSPEYLQNNNSPEAGSFNFGNNNVDYYTGKANINIPIHTYKGLEMDFPISLGYTTDGIKVDEIANYTGLGWNLDFGGRITPIINFHQDESAYNPDNGFYDYYMLQLPGVTEYFQMQGNNPIAQKNPTIMADIRNQTSNWVVYMPDGSRYFFDIMETTSIYGANPRTYTSSWLLTKIISKNGLDNYNLNYSLNTWNDQIPTHGEGYISISTYGGSGELYSNTHSEPYKVSQASPTAIFHNGEKIIGFTYGVRTDISFLNSFGNALKSINIYNYDGLANNPSVFRKVAFDYGYFGNAFSANNFPNYLNKRLQLKTLTFLGVDLNNSLGVAGDTYTFTYNNPELVPPIASFAQDYLGLYNGLNSNTSLLDNPDSPTDHVKRKFSLAKSQYGTLKQITYPGGGYTTYDFEQNTLDGFYEHYQEGITYQTHQVDVVRLPTAINQQGSYLHCQLPGSQNFTYNQAMAHYSGYPIQNVYTTLLQVNTGGNYYIANSYNQNPLIYLIQPLNELICDQPAQNCYCSYTYPGTNIIHTCLYPTAGIIYDPRNPLPAAYIAGGDYHYTREDREIYLPAGNYQVTLWQYSVNTAPSYGSLRIYKKVTTAIPPHLVDADIQGTPSDGFRIKTITSRTEDGSFAGRREFKYGGGQLFAPITNYSAGHITSQGYIYNDAVFYDKVSEKITDSVGSSHGHTQYVFSNNDHPRVDILNDVVPKDGIEKRYSPSGGIIYTTFIKGSDNYSAVKEKKIFDEDGYLVSHIKNQFNSFEYTTPEMQYNEYIGYHLEPVPTKFCFLESVTSTNYPEHWQGITNTVLYDYAADSEICQPASKSISYSNEQDNFTYHYGISSIPANNMYGNFGVIVPTAIEYPTYRLDFTYGVNGSPSLPITITRNGDANTKTELMYDNGKVVTKIRHTSGTLTPASKEAYIYGYSKRFPVAKIIGKTYAEIEALTPAIIPAIISAGQFPVSITNENRMRVALNSLRAAYPECQITTYTYNPAFGMTSTTDPKGYTIYYEYDIFGRLRFTKEMSPSGNFIILSENQYNTRSTQP